MREQKPYGKRTPSSKKKEPKRRYILAFEGENTERLYFSGVRAYTEDLGISDTIDIVPIQRHYKDRGKSHPKHVCQLLLEHVEEHTSENLTAKQLRVLCADWIMDQKHVPKNTRVERLLQEAFERHGIHDDDTDTPMSRLDLCICDVLAEILPEPKRLVQDFHAYLMKDRSFKVDDWDVACIIIDRDVHSVSDEQYDSVLSFAREHKICPYVTNPRFELWLLLHFIGRDDIDVEKILQDRQKGEEAYLEKELHRYLPGFSKSSVPFHQLYDKVSDAVYREHDFCEDVAELKSSVGCNIGLLISEMQQNTM